MTTIPRTLAATALAVGAFSFAPSPASADDQSASPYAFEAAPGCLGLHTGLGIDGYYVDGEFYDVPDTNAVRTIRYNATSGMQADFRAVALPGFEGSNVKGAQWVTVTPGEGCGEDEGYAGDEEQDVAACAAVVADRDRLAGVVGRQARQLDRKAARIDSLRAKVERLRDRLHAGR